MITGIVPCLYDSRLKLAREVLGEIRKYFGAQVFPHPVRTNVKLAEAPSYGKTIFEYAPDSNGAQDYRWVAREVMAREARDPDLAQLPPYSDTPGTRPLPTQAPRAVITPVAPASSVVRPSAAPKSKAGVEKKAAPAAIERTPTASSGEPAAALDPKRKSSPITPASVAPTAKRPSKPPASDLEKRAHTTPPAVTNVKAPASARADVRAPPADVHAPPADIHAPSRDVPELPRGARRVLRAEDLPPLPPDAFEILTNYVRDA